MGARKRSARVLFLGRGGVWDTLNIRRYNLEGPFGEVEREYKAARLTASSVARIERLVEGPGWGRIGGYYIRE